MSAEIQALAEKYKQKIQAGTISDEELREVTRALTGTTSEKVTQFVRATALSNLPQLIFQDLLKRIVAQEATDVMKSEINTFYRNIGLGNFLISNILAAAKRHNAPYPDFVLQALRNIELANPTVYNILINEQATLIRFFQFSFMNAALQEDTFARMQTMPLERNLTATSIDWKLADDAQNDAWLKENAEYLQSNPAEIFKIAMADSYAALCLLGDKSIVDKLTSRNIVQIMSKHMTANTKSLFLGALLESKPDVAYELVNRAQPEEQLSKEDCLRLVANINNKEYCNIIINAINKCPDGITVPKAQMQEFIAAANQKLQHGMTYNDHLRLVMRFHLPFAGRSEEGLAKRFGGKLGGVKVVSSASQHARGIWSEPVPSDTKPKQAQPLLQLSRHRNPGNRGPSH